MKTLQSFVLLFFFTICHTVTTGVYSQCLKDQQLSLLHLKKSLTFYDDDGDSIGYPPVSSKFVSWNSSTDCCSWVGVTCSSKGRVVGLDISSQNISDGIGSSSSLFDLQHLQSLNLADNSFVEGSRFPSAIGKLTNLRYLNLSNNDYVGKIPVEISHLTRLEVLDISQSEYFERSGTLESPKFSMLFQNLTELTELYLDGIDVSAEGTHWCQAISSSLPNLRVLSLSRTNLSGPIDQSLAKLQSLSVIQLGGYPNNISGPIPGFFSNFSNLTVLNLDGTNISAPVPVFFANFSKLTTLSLFDCGLRGTFPKQIFQVPTLQTIDLSYNWELHVSLAEFPNFSNLTVLNLDGTNISAPVPVFFANFSKLTTLSLFDCGLRGTFPKQIFQVPTLHTIDLFWNTELHVSLLEFPNFSNLTVLNLDGTNISAPVPVFFANFSKLTTLSLFDCGLRGTFPKQIFQVPTLHTIDLSLNRELHGSLPEFPKNGSLRSLFLGQTSFSGSLPDSIGNLNMLSVLDLSYCNFTRSIPKSIGNLTKLHFLDLSSNQLVRSIPSSLFSLPLLWVLDLSNCSFTGSIPKSIGNLTKLFDLSLNDNQLVGSIPSSLFSLPLLEYLDLSDNNFTGRVPEIFNVSSSSVTYIDLSFNNLEGPVPVSIFNFRELHSLTLSSNNFSAFPFNGPHPLPYLTEIDLSHNSLLVLYNGSNSSYSSFPGIIEFRLDSNKLRTFPVFLRNLANLTNLDLSENQIQGQIPNWICDASGLLTLDLSSNSLSGEIPQCLAAMSGLVILNVRKNSITGMISNLEFSENLGVLDLSHNQIEGQFPKSLVRCRGLQILNLEENQITDTFPCMLKNISDLRVLALRSNNFYGGIGCPVVKTNATWPALQILDLAHNNFNGEVPGFSLTTLQAMKDNTTSGFLSTVPGYMTEFPQVQSTSDNAGGLPAPAPGQIYYEPITITSKGLKMDLPKIPIVLTLIDFSCNNFSGPIPKEMGALENLYLLNLSSNTFTGEIPSSFGNMRQLESLDLSQNKLSGQIPQQLAKLSFLAFMNLSNNQLVGKIPAGTQISTFPRDSFTGNKGLWGPPLTVDNKAGLSPPPTLNGSHPNSSNEIDWDLISVEIGFVFGFAVAVGSLVFFKRWSKWYYRSMYKIIVRIFPQLEERIGPHRRHVHINQRSRR